MRPVTIIFAFFLVIAPLRADAQTPLASVPYEIAYDGWITVKVAVNGAGPYDFIVDTGATLTLAFENLRQEQSFTATNLPPRRILGFASAITAPVTNIGDIEIGGEIMRDHQGVVLSDWAPPRKTPHGVLGLDFLSRYLVVVDRDAQRIELYAPDAAPEKIRKWPSAPLEARSFGQDLGALYTVDVRVNNRTAPFIVDLGASGTILNFSMLRELYAGIRFNPSSASGAATGTRLNDINDKRDSGQLIRVLRIKIGRAYWRRPILLAFDAEIFRELGVASTPFGLLGADLLSDRSFSLNFEKGEFRAERKPHQTQ